MKLQDQVCTLEQDKRLRELGITEPSAFYWMPGKDGPHDQPYIRFGWHGDALAPAYNVAELGVTLPFECESRKDEVNDEGGSVPGFTCGLCNTTYFEFRLTEAQARAAILIRLLEMDRQS